MQIRQQDFQYTRWSVLELLLLKTCWFGLFLWFRNRKVRPSGNKQVCRKSRLVWGRDKTRAGRRRHNYYWSTIINKVTCVTWSVTRTHAPTRATTLHATVGRFITAKPASLKLGGNMSDRWFTTLLHWTMNVIVDCWLLTVSENMFVILRWQK